MHARVRGELREPAGRFPAGTPYRADDPELLLWILAALAESAVLVYRRYVCAIDRAEQDALWRDYRVVGQQFGLAGHEMPATIADFEDYMSAMYASGDLVVTPEARELGIEIVMHPPAPLALRPVVELVNQITVGLLPRDVRRQYGLRWDPLRSVALRGGAEYVRRVLVPVLPDQLRMIPVAR
jgi:uncharacterized protein (DUF2236 family)